MGLWDFLTDMTVRPQCKAEQPTATKREREGVGVRRLKGTRGVRRLIGRRSVENALENM